MAFTRIVGASRGAMMMRARAPIMAPLAARRPASTFPGDDLDDQEPVRRETGRSQDWSTYAAVGGVGLLVVTIFYYMTNNPEDAARKQEKARNAVKDTKEKVKDNVLPERK